LGRRGTYARRRASAGTQALGAAHPESRRRDRQHTTATGTGGEAPCGPPCKTASRQARGGVYLPTHAERQEIFGIHLTLRGRDRQQFDLDQLAKQTEAYTGADIKEVVQMGLKLAFHAGEQLTVDHLLAAIPEIRPLSKTDPESVTEVTKWLDSHTKPAGNGHSTTQPLDGKTLKRRVTV
jgi:hypothetical protein